MSLNYILYNYNCHILFRDFRSFEYSQAGQENAAYGQMMPSQPYQGTIFTPQVDAPIGGLNAHTGEYPPTDPDNEPPLLEGFIASIAI